MIVLETDIVRLVLSPEFGARVTSLVDRRTGRDWIVPGRLNVPTDEGAPYLAAQAAGWDECFPTVGACDARNTAWGRRLRDHGDLWGRCWDVLHVTDDRVSTRYRGKEYDFERSITLSGEDIFVDYRVISRSVDTLPFLWALHLLVAPVHGDRLDLPDEHPLEITHTTTAIEARWPAGNPAHPLGLSIWPPHSSPAAYKIFLRDLPDRSARICGANGSLEFCWTGLTQQTVGVWLCVDGWPDEEPVRQVALEPTSSAADDLISAIDKREAELLQPAAERRWQVQLSLRARSPD